MKLTNVGYIAKMNKQKTRKGRERNRADALKPFHRDRRAGPGGRDGRVSDRGTVRMGGLPNQGAGKALAGGAALAGYPDTDGRQLL